MPIRPETSFPQPPHSAFGQIAVLETSAAQNHALIPAAACHCDDYFYKGIMKLRGNNLGLFQGRQFLNDFGYHRSPIHRNAVFAIHDRERVILLGPGSVGQKL